jgi:hypothetical protein
MKMKLLNLRIFILVLMTGMILQACTKEDAETFKDYIIGTWTATTPTVSITVNSQTLVQFYTSEGLSAADAQAAAAMVNSMVAQGFTGTLQVKSDGTYIANFGGEADAGTWTLSEDGKKLTIDSNTDDAMTIDVVELTSSKLSLQTTETENADLNDDGTDETMTMNITLNFSK